MDLLYKKFQKNITDIPEEVKRTDPVQKHKFFKLTAGQKTIFKIFGKSLIVGSICAFLFFAVICGIKSCVNNTYICSDGEVVFSKEECALLNVELYVFDKYNGSIYRCDFNKIFQTDNPV